MGISSSAITPDASSILEMRTSTKGLLMPRLTTIERDAITLPATGLIIYNTTTNKFNFYNGSSWIGMFSGSSVVNSVTGTSNRITIGGTAADPTVDISSSYVGQSSITTLGTIGTGVWNGTIITSGYGGTGNGFSKFSGATTSEKTYTLPDASATILTDNATVTAGQGGTGNATYAVGDLLYASAATTLSKLAGVASGNALISGGVSTAPSWGKIGLTTHVSGTLPIANGGTNSIATPTDGGIVYGDGTAYQLTAAGTAAQVLKSQGTNAPTWEKGVTIVTLGSDVVNNNGTANTIADVTGLSFSVTSGVTYNFRALIVYTSAATTTGSRWSVNGPATTLLAYSSQYALTATTNTFSNAVAYNIPAASNTTSASTTGNIAIIEGIITPSASGTVIIRFASEVANSAITAKAGSTLTWW